MNGRESNEDGVVVVDGWTTVGGAAQAQDRAMTRAIKDDESESDETLSLSYHTTEILLLTMLRARTTRQLVLLHACTQ
jgi:hypothetical protein